VLVHTSVHTEVLPVGLRSELAYGELKQRLLRGDFRLGARLKESRLASMLGVSRTPVREALLRLHAEGLVQRQSDGGYVPVVPDVAAIRWLYEVRAGLELQAIRRAPHDLEIVAGLLEEWEALAGDEPEPDPSFVLLDESFHLGLAESAGNPVLVDLLRQVNERIRVVRMVDFLTPDRITSTVTEHVGIAAAVLAGDLIVVEQQFLGHLDHSQAVVEQRVAAAIARMASAPDVEEDQ
jgi:DNA-binding GntR family transcriptional regulator